MSVAPQEQPKRLQPAHALTFTVQAASELSGLGKTTLYALLRDGKLRRIKVGDRTLIGGDSLRALLGMDAA
jgi:excisionase family DNA binding protein